jgi:alanyl-tRNA synthetase
MLSHDIRRAFLDFFVSKGHTQCPSSSLVPNDPTLMFANAGMVPFKDVFTGKEKRGYSRATSSQKCIRISGKHNDLENVGRTARHHTFFEMLGNFSFGDYFKEDAIAYAWELFTRVLDLPQDRLIITVFGGAEGIAPDDEAREIWRKVTGWGDERIVGMPGVPGDNFWQMGDTGFCGPSSEIHFWQGPVPDGGVPFGRFGEEPDADGNGWFELWNLVFMQFDRSKNDDGSFTLTPLPAPSIDTGAGLERLASVLQGVKSNYDTDLLQALVQKAAQISGKEYGKGTREDDDSMRIIADHARLTAFLMAEGISPDRNGREYVLRRVMRRAIRHGHRLGIHRPFFHEVALEVVRTMGEAYPELRERQEYIATTTEQEEIRFRETLDRGIKLIAENEEWTTEGERRVMPGSVAFKLYDTFGFPLDLTEVIGQEQGFGVDQAGFDAAMAEARARSEGSVLNKDEGVTKALHDALALVPGGAVKFTGYEAEDGEGKVVALVSGGVMVDRVAWEGGEGDLPEVDVIVDVTPFYGRSGGQVGDTGEIRVKGGAGRVLVHETDKPVTGLVVHRTKLAQGAIAVGDTVELEVDHERRSATRRNHSATHLLHWALGQVLGEHAEQKGSLVGPDVLRFDFSHQKPLTPGEIERIEDLVNQKILVNAPVLTEVLPISEAKKRGAKAIFEEKYGDVVRVLTMTKDSVELCGGTHARALGDIGLFTIQSETGVAAGVRRIEAATGWNALGVLRDQSRLLRDIATATKSNAPRPRVEAITALNDRVKELEKERADLVRKLATGGGGGIDLFLAQAQEIGGVKVLGLKTEVADASALRELAEQLRDKLGESSVVLVASAAGGKVQLVVTVSKSQIGRLKAGDLVRPIAQIVGGNGGGRPDMAMAGGSDATKIDEAVAAIYEKVSATLSV